MAHEMHWRATGHGRHTVVLLHGLGGDIDFWDDTVSVLSKSMQVIALDLRGSGGTPATPGGHTIADLADDVRDTLDAENIERAHVIGFSMGGLVAQSFATRHSERLDRLVLASTFQTMSVRSRVFLDAIANMVHHGVSDRQVFELVGPWLFSSMYLSQPENADVLHFPDDIEEQAGEGWLNQYAAQRKFDSRTLGTIAAPTLVLGGADDSLVPTCAHAELARAIPAAQLSLIDGAGHLINVEEPERFHREILDFLQQPTGTA
jgi:3-oxoadipate enol-lactonase